MERARYGIKNGLITYLQYTTDFVKAVFPPLPEIRCRIYQIEPSFVLSDDEVSIEADLTSDLKFTVREHQQRWISITKYAFNRMPGTLYNLIFEEFIVLPQTEDEVTIPKDCLEDATVKKYIEIHTRFIERQRLAQYADDLLSFDAIAMGSSDKQPVCFRQRNFVPLDKPEMYIKVGKAKMDGFLDVTLDDLKKNTIILTEKLKMPLKTKSEPIEVEVEQKTERKKFNIQNINKASLKKPRKLD